MSSPSRDIAAILETSEISLGTFGVDLFVGVEPITPDNCVTLFDTGGFEPQPNYNYERPTVQIQVRNKSYAAGYAAAQELQDALNGEIDHIVGSYRYVGIWVMSGINSIGRDDNNRALFTINLRIHRTKTT